MVPLACGCQLKRGSCSRIELPVHSERYTEREKERERENVCVCVLRNVSGYGKKNMKFSGNGLF